MDTAEDSGRYVPIRGQLVHLGERVGDLLGRRRRVEWSLLRHRLLLVALQPVEQTHRRSSS